MIPDAPVVSILTPTRNRRRSYLPQAIASVRALSLSVVYEHVVVDDASDDGTAAYLATEAESDPCLIPVYHPQPRGVASARNSAARQARGTYLVDLDDDDLLTVHGVERRLAYLRAHSEFWALHANALKIDEQGRYLVGEDVENYYCADRDRCARLFYDTMMLPNASTAMYRRDVLMELGGWDKTLSCCEDYDLWLRSLERYGPPGFISDIVALYRKKEHSLGIDSVRSGAHERNQRLLRRRYAHLVVGRADT